MDTQNCKYYDCTGSTLIQVSVTLEGSKHVAIHIKITKYVVFDGN